MSKKNKPNLLTAPIGLVQSVVHELAVKKGWWPMLSHKDLSVAQKLELVSAAVPMRLALIHADISKALEEYCTKKRHTEVSWGEDDGDERPAGLPIALADVIINTLDLAQALDIDLGYWIARKHEFNEAQRKRSSRRRG